MRYVIQFGKTLAYVDNGKWYSKDPYIRRYLNNMEKWLSLEDSFTHYPDMDERSAQRMIETIGGKIIEKPPLPKEIKGRIY